MGMSEDELNDYLEFAKGLAEEAGKIMLNYFRSDQLKTSWKGNSPVTVADNEINQLVIKRVKSAYPNFGVLGEEDSIMPERECIWVVDPIDGTNLFQLGMPNSTFCLSMVKDGSVLVAVVYDPYLKRLFTSVKGSGTYLNGKKLRVKPITELKHGYIFAQADKTDNSGTTARIHKELKKAGVKLMAIPSFTYMALAILEGRMLAAFMPYGSPWDAAAISLLVEEAGGRSTDLQGNSRRYSEWGEGIMVSNGAIHDKLIGIIQDADSRD